MIEMRGRARGNHRSPSSSADEWSRHGRTGSLEIPKDELLAGAVGIPHPQVELVVEMGLLPSTLQMPIISLLICIINETKSDSKLN